MTLVLAAMLAGPLAAQLLGIRSPWLRGWRMFAGQGLGIVQLDGEVRLSDGTRRPLAVTDLRDVKARSPKSKLVEAGRERAALRDVCRRVPEAMKVTARKRTAVREGWTAWETLRPVECAALRDERDDEARVRPLAKDVGPSEGGDA